MRRCSCRYLWALVGVLLLLPMAPSARAAEQLSVAVHTVPLQKHRMNDTITAFGTVQPDPKAQTTRNATYAAFVRRLDVTLGQPVEKGDPLLTLQTAPTARATYLQAQTNVRYARQAVSRQRELLKQRLATHANVSAAEQTLAQAEAALAAQKELGTDQKIRVVKAPFTGIVSQLPINPGNQVQLGTLLFQLARRDRLQVSLGIEPDEAGRLQKGMTVQVVPLFGTGNGVASQISQVNAVVDPNTRLVNAIAPLDGENAKPFLPGMRVKGHVKLATDNTLAVQRSAVLKDDHGSYLFVVDHGKARRINVQIGLEQNGLVAIKAKQDALKTGQSVVVQGNYELSDGMAVRQAS